ncbi:MAG: SPFH domain-containing protein [Candidatus Micrarchaeota archaeon]|nr:SPFH domain-containing protein [Candidatus Micrarchaeota archaeon]MCX8154304.1 SPFH domain-containing protein [Candidatus Micrarchaeota archaeon]
MDLGLLFWLFVVIIIASLVFRVIVVVKQSELGLLMRLGKYVGKLGPGIHIITPIIDSVIIVDLRESLIDVKPQEVITKDNVNVVVDAVVYYQIIDPERAVFGVTDVILAISQLAQTTLRARIGELELDELLSARETLNARMRETLDVETDKWGVKITKVEVKRIDPPPKIQEAMAQQMTAERERRAKITLAEADKQDAILRAEGYKQSNILKAEGDARSNVLRAEAEAKSYVLKMEAEAKGIELKANAEAQARLILGESEAKALRMIREELSKAGSKELLLYTYYNNLPKVAQNGKSIIIPYETAQQVSSLVLASEFLKQDK